MSVLEGLNYSARPCARVLSVAGLLSFIWRFPGREGFILRLKKAPLLRAEALTVDVPEETVIGPATLLSNSLFTPERLGREAVYTPCIALRDALVGWWEAPGYPLPSPTVKRGKERKSPILAQQ